MLDVLAANRNLQSVIKEAEPMLRMHIEELASYEMGIEKGMAKGQANVVKRLLDRFEEQDVAEMTGLDPEIVHRLNNEKWPEQ